MSPLCSPSPQVLSQNAILPKRVTFANHQPTFAGKRASRRQSGTVSHRTKERTTHTTTQHARMSDGTNTAPARNSHMLVQLLLCIGLPFLILPLLATAAYLGLRWYKAKKSKPVTKDVERGDFVFNSPRQDSEDDSTEPQHTMTLALISNSVQVPVAFGRNF